MKTDFEALGTTIFGSIMLIGVIMNAITTDMRWLMMDLVLCGIVLTICIISIILKRKP